MEELKEALERRFAQGCSIRDRGDSMQVSLPLHDRSGDFVRVRVRSTEAGVLIDDAGAIAHLLFALDDDGPKGTRAYRFFEEAVSSYGLTPHADGRLQLVTGSDPDAAAGGVLYFAKIVLSLDALLVNILRDGAVSNAVPGRRIVSEITRELRKRNLLQRMDRRWAARGTNNPEWKVHYAYGGASSDSRRVLIVGVDLAVKDPIRNAAHVIALALDVKSPQHDLRVAYSAYGRNGPSAYAADLIRGHGVGLLTPFDLADKEQHQGFFDAVADDLGAELR